jgi:NADPH:quinone reductase
MEIWSDLLNFISEGKLVPVVMDPVYEGLSALPEGLTALAERRTWGKAVIRVRPDPKFPPKKASKM